jgi:hypothetical protein
MFQLVMLCIVRLVQVSFVLQCDGTELVNSMQHDGGQLWLGYLGSAACSGPTALIQVPPPHKVVLFT